MVRPTDLETIVIEQNGSLQLQRGKGMPTTQGHVGKHQAGQESEGSRRKQEPEVFMGRNG